MNSLYRTVTWAIAALFIFEPFDHQASGQEPTIVSVKKLNEVHFANLFSGADAAAKINAACNDLPATGGTVDARGLEGAQTWSTDPFTGITKPCLVLLGSGTTTFQVNINIPSNSGIIGLGPGRSILTVPNATNIRIQNSNPTGGNSNIVLRDLEVDGNKLNQTQPTIPIGFKGVVGLWIMNVYCHDGEAGCISLDNNAAGAAGRSAYILNNRVENTDQGTQFPIQVGPNWSQVIIANNYVRGAFAASIGVDGASHVTIEGNLVESTGAGIDIEATSAACSNVTVKNNIIKSLTASAQDAIKAAATNFALTDILIEGNIVDTVERGIFITEVGTGSVRGIRVRGNIIHDLQLAGISATTGSLSELEISGNWIYNAGKNTGAAASDRAGITASATTDLLIYGNRATDFQGSKTQTYGLYLTSTTGQAWVYGNDFRGNLTAEIFDDSSGGNIAVLRRSGTDQIFRGNIGFESGTAFLGTVDHAITAARTWTLPNTSSNVAGSVARNVTGVGTGTATGETDLQTVTLNANAMGSGGAIRITAAGTTAGMNSTKEIKLYFGSLLIASFQELATGTRKWTIIAEVYNNNATNSQKLWVRAYLGTGVQVGDYKTGAVDTTVAVSIKTTGTTPDSGDEVTSEILMLEII